MITEKGTVKLKTKFDENLYIEVNAKVKKLAIFNLVAGPILIIAGLLLRIFSIANTLGVVLIAIGIFDLVLGVTLLNSRKKSIEHAHKWKIEHEFEFFSDRIEIHQTVSDEDVVFEKIYLAWTKEPKESKSYITFGNATNPGPGLYYINKSVATEDELNIVRALLKLPLVPTAQIPAYPNPIQAPSEQTDNALNANVSTEENSESTSPAEESAPKVESTSAEEQPAPQIKHINK